MGDEQGLRLALQASRAGSVTPVLHHSGQSRARCTAPPVKRRIGRFDSCDRSQSTRRSSMGRTLGLSRLGPEFESPSPHHHPSIAQWTRAPGCGPGGRRFESCWMVHFQGVAQPGSAPGLEPRGRRFESYRPDHFVPAQTNRRRPCDAMTSINCRPFETSRKRRRGICLGNAGAARRPRRARRQGANRETRAQRPVPVRLRAAVSRNAACASAASTAASGTIISERSSCNGAYCAPLLIGEWRNWRRGGF